MYSSAEVLEYALQHNFIDSEEDRLIYLYNLDFLLQKYQLIKNSFPKNSSHTIPVKTAPLLGLLKFAVQNGMGLECASEIEFEMALQAKAKTIVINAPLKTPRLIKLLDNCNQQIHINVNDLRELDKFKNVYQKHFISIRINPLVDIQTANYLQTANQFSKFGHLISKEEEIFSYIQKYPFVKGLHVHTGSNFTDFTPTILGIEKVYHLAEKINNTYSNQILSINIGGGLSASCDLSLFAKELFAKIPDLEKSKYHLLTEYGRFVYQNAAFAASIVEIIKDQIDKDLILCHFGGQAFVREIYTNDKYQGEITVLQQQKNKNIKKYAIAGPLCYGGDFLVNQINLPKVQENDWIILQNVGGNSLGLFSKHCSQAFPKVLAYQIVNNQIQISILKQKEQSQDVIHFWG
jgi:diaminopimelate decarboxylase